MYYVRIRMYYVRTYKTYNIHIIYAIYTLNMQRLRDTHTQAHQAETKSGMRTGPAGARLAHMYIHWYSTPPTASSLEVYTNAWSDRITSAYKTFVDIDKKLKRGALILFHHILASLHTSST